AGAYAQSVGKPMQEAAREWRYNRFAADMKELGWAPPEMLATAHHLNDQAETLLYRFLRGSGTAGLAGIWPDRLEKGWDEPLRIIRPLLTVTKNEILAYCQERGIHYARDMSNESDRYTRNRIRLALMPQLEKEYNPRLQDVLSHTAEVMRWDEVFFQKVVDEKWQLYGQGTQGRTVTVLWAAWQEPEAILSRLLRRAAAIAREEPRGLELKYVKKLMEGNYSQGWSQDLPGVKVTAAAAGMVFRQWTMDNGQWTMDKADIFQPVDQWTMDKADILQPVDQGARDKAVILQPVDQRTIGVAANDVVLVPNQWQKLSLSDEEGDCRKGCEAQSVEDFPHCPLSIVHCPLPLSIVHCPLNCPLSLIGLFPEKTARELLSLEPHIRKIGEIWLDEAAVAGRGEPIEYRRRRPGDKVYVAGVGHKQLKKIWQECGVPAWRRDQLGVVAMGTLVLAIPALNVVSRPVNVGMGPVCWWLMSSSGKHCL
ncbi:MAG: tRNA lysidine(34) synthetase TilS, partial [Gracilibacteraceae bacterium]|nr:tRNA lysidine(34) synthetase TilS [Gracilibacteraceae bacterium]